MARKQAPLVAAGGKDTAEEDLSKELQKLEVKVTCCTSSLADVTNQVAGGLDRVTAVATVTLTSADKKLQGLIFATELDFY
jgi:hypothetical protein